MQQFFRGIHCHPSCAACPQWPWQEERKGAILVASCAFGFYSFAMVSDCSKWPDAERPEKPRSKTGTHDPLGTNIQRGQVRDCICLLQLSVLPSCQSYLHSCVVTVSQLRHDKSRLLRRAASLLPCSSLPAGPTHSAYSAQLPGRGGSCNGVPASGCNGFIQMIPCMNARVARGVDDGNDHE